MDKSLGILLHFRGVFQFTQVQPLPSPYKQPWTRVSRILSKFQLCIGWGEGELQENFQKDAVFFRENREMTEKYEYCSTVLGTFVQDCSAVNRTKPNQKSIDPNRSDCCTIGSAIEHNRTGTFRWVRLPNSIERIDLDIRELMLSDGSNR